MMKTLWAPWRVEYIEGARALACIFCGASKRKELLLFSSRHSVVLLNKYPYNSAHLLIAPKRHLANLEKLSAKESSDISNLLSRSVSILKKAYKAEGFNIGMNLGKAAGAGIEDHLHWHVVPRWNGDTNFMPALSEVKVMPEHLQKTLEKLRPHFKKMRG